MSFLLLKTAWKVVFVMILHLIFRDNFLSKSCKKFCNFQVMLFFLFFSGTPFYDDLLCFHDFLKYFSVLFFKAVQHKFWLYVCNQNIPYLLLRSSLNNSTVVFVMILYNILTFGECQKVPLNFDKFLLNCVVFS